MSSFQRILNLPIPVRFAGFESDTCRLQSAGWELAVHQGMPHRGDFSIMLAMRYPSSGEDFYAISRVGSYREWHYATLRGPELSPPDLNKMSFDVQCVNNSIRLYVAPAPSAVNFRAFDAFPVAESRAISEHRIEDIVPFRTLPTDKKELWIPKSCISEALDRIAELQEPKQAEIRERERKEEARGALPDELRNYRSEQVEAQIFSIA